MNNPNGVNGREQTPTGSPPDEKTAQSNGETASGASDQTPKEKEQAIPYDRFREVNEDKKQYQQRVLQLESQIQQMQNQQQQFLQQQMQPKQEQKPKANPNIERVKDILGRDEMGQKAFEAMEMLSEAKAQELLETYKQQMMQDVNNTIGQKVGGVTASLQTQKHIDDMVTSKRITPDVANQLKQQVAQAIRQYPQWETQQPLLVNTLLGNMYASGQLKAPQTNQMDGTPLQPSGDYNGSPGSSSVQRDAERLKRFPSLCNKSDKDLRTVVEGVRNEMKEMANGY